MLRAFFWFYSQGSLLAVFRGAGGETQVRRKRGARQMFYSRYYLSTSFSSPIYLMFYFVIGSHWVVLETTSSSVLQVGARKVPGKKSSWQVTFSLSTFLSSLVSVHRFFFSCHSWSLPHDLTYYCYSVFLAARPLFRSSRTSCHQPPFLITTALVT